MDEKRLTVIQKDASDKPSSDNLSDSDAHSDANPVVTLYSVVILYSDSDASSLVVTLYSVVMNSDGLYSSIVIE